MQNLYCPKCGHQAFKPIENKAYQCNQCGFLYYHNVAATSSAIIECDNKILLVIRAHEPGQGLLDLPGGFAEPNETLEQALARELKEELDYDMHQAPVYIASFPNRYFYRDIWYNTLDAFFSIQLEAAVDFSAADDVAGYHWLEPEQINYEQIAFGSIKKALQQYLQAYNK